MASCKDAPEVGTARTTGERTERELRSPGVSCMPVGTPGMWTINPYPHQLITKPGMYVHLIESDNAWRVIHTDGRPHKKKEDLEPFYNGDHVAHWEGDKLTVYTPTGGIANCQHDMARDLGIPDDKVIDIVEKTWRKMGPKGRALALELVGKLAPDRASLVARAVAEAEKA